MSITMELVEQLGMGLSDVHRVIGTAPARYFVFQIAKRKGGQRTIAQPARELKAIQRYILANKLSLFPVHKCATAYMPGSSIRINALEHVDSDFILKLDFEEFFPSIRVADWLKFARKHKHEEILLADLPIYSKILFWGGQPKSVKPVSLSIGAPTSPALSNILMYGIDSELSRIAEGLHVTYTRYADDITVSGREAATVLEFERLARRIIAKRKSPVLRFNEGKRGLFTKGGRRSVTGLILTPDRNVSIGRSRKREISAMLHHLSLGRLEDEGKAFLKGMLGFCISVEVEFVERLRLKYGDKLIDAALRYHIPAKSIPAVPELKTQLE